MTSERRVREIAPGDRDALSSLLHATPEFSDEERAVALELVDARLSRSDDYEVLVVERDDVLEGYVCFGPTPMTEGAWDLYWIATAHHARRTGAGVALVTALEARLRSIGARLVRLETSSRPEYAATRRFYDKAGFIVAATLRDFYAPGDDLVIYLRVLA